jgi:hypothetical protein
MPLWRVNDGVGKMKSLRDKLLATWLFVSLGLGSTMTSVWAIECPTLQPLGGEAGAPADLTRQLAANDVLTQIPGILGHLRQQFPDAGKRAFVDYLVAAYCPVIAGRADLNEQEKVAKLREFANAVIATEY